MKCEKCGADINKDTKYCANCGALVNNVVENDNNVINETNDPNNANIVTDANVIETNDTGVTNDNVVVSSNITNAGKENVFKKFFNDKRVMLGLGVLLALIIIIAGVLRFINKSPKQIFNKSIDELFKTVENKMEPITSKQVAGTTNIKMSMTGLGEVGEVFNNLALDFNYDIDYDKKIMNMNFKPTYGKDAIIDMSANFNNGDAYMYLNDVFNKYIKLPIDKKVTDEMFSSKGNEDTKTLLDEMKKELKDSLSSKYFDKEKDEIKIDGDYVKVTKSTMTLKGKDLQEVLKTYMTNLKENNKIVKTYGEINNLSDKEVIKQFDDSIKELNVSSDQQLIVSIYTKGLFNDFKGVSINVKSADQNMGINVLKIAKDNYEYKIESNNSVVARGTVKVEDKDNKNITVLSLNVGIANMKLTVTNDIKKDAKVSAKKITNYVEADKLTDEEQTQISNNILSGKGMKALIKEINELINGYSNLGY